MGEENNVYVNNSKCADPTAGEAISHIDKESERFHKLLTTIFTICELSGYHLEGRITIKDKKTGRIWK